MQWNWQQSEWPEFSWKQARLLKAEALFLVEAGEYAGTAKHLGAEDREQLTVDAMSVDADRKLTRLEG
jgi:Fic family protein